MDKHRNLLDKWADILLTRSLGGVRPGETVMIRGEHAAWPLIELLQEKILRSGGMADIAMAPPDNERGRIWSAAVSRLGDLRNLRAAPAWQRLRNEAADKVIEILGMEDPEAAKCAEGPVMKRILELDAGMREIRREKKWVVTMYPTEAFARVEGLPFRKYAEAVIRGATEPFSRTLKTAEKISAALSKTRELSILTSPRPGGRILELKMIIEGQRILNDLQGINIPQGEVFTSPLANSVNGEIFLDMPILVQGEIISGTHLKFTDGEVVAFRSKNGGRKLSEIIRTDSGAKRVGEVAFGINTGLSLPLKHPLFCEKIGGTMHIALGTCFPEAFGADLKNARGRRRFSRLLRSGSANHSSQHVDLVVSFNGGAGREVLLDGKKLSKSSWTRNP
jgi:aminopeptidase